VKPTNVALAERFFDRLPESEWVELIDPEIEIHDFDLPDAGVYRGHEGLARYLAQWEEAWEGWDWTIEEVLESGDQVVVLFEIRARSESGPPTSRRNGTVLTLRDGKIVRFEYYSEQDEARSAAGLPSSSG
jgi:uncharacterized protein